MSNVKLAQKTLEQLLLWGVKDICLCPGGRNSPFVFSFENPTPFTIHSSFDERSAGFYALGLSQKSERPTAIITTSGTAVAEVFPSVIEGHYTQTPIIVITADRPRRMRGTGAPQTIDQVHIFSSYVENCVDIAEEWPSANSPQGVLLSDWSGRSPLHLNICFDEPLKDGEVSPITMKADEPAPTFPPLLPIVAQEFFTFLKEKKNPLLLISGLKTSEVEPALAFAKKWPGFIYAESTSGLRELDHPGLIVSGDRFPSYLLKSKKIDGVLRLGGVPTARLWRDLEANDFPVFSLSSLPFAGLSQNTASRRFHCVDLNVLYNLTEALGKTPTFAAEDKTKDQNLYQKWQQLLKDFPLSEPALVKWFSEQVMRRSSCEVYVGNSLPIREWDLAAQNKIPLHVRANRGANGIDGQISTALGYRQPDKDLFILIGDLTAMYDANALWFKQNSQIKSNCVIAIINNRGGKIFQRLFNQELFYNSHSLDFKHWAAAWNCSYSLITEPSVLPDDGVVELQPDLKQTEIFWQKYDELFRSELT